MDCSPVGARQAPLSRGFSWQQYWSGLAFSTPGLPNPGIELSHQGGPYPEPKAEQGFYWSLYPIDDTIQCGACTFQEHSQEKQYQGSPAVYPGVSRGDWLIGDRWGVQKRNPCSLPESGASSKPQLPPLSPTRGPGLWILPGPETEVQTETGLEGWRRKNAFDPQGAEGAALQ